MIVGALVADNNGRGASGSSYVVYGAASQANLDLAALPHYQGFRVDGAAANDQSGLSVSGAGDVNGDDRDDVIVGAFTADNNGRTDSGSSYLVYSTFLPRVSYERRELGEVGQPFSARPLARSFTGSPLFLVNPALPAGLNLNMQTGEITGTPTTPGVATYEISLTDALGVTSERVQIAIVNAQGPAGPTGPGGPQGPAASQGPAGPQGPAGKNATVKCSVGKPKGKGKTKVKVTCKVAPAGSARAVSQRATLSRGGRVYARATRSGPGPIRFRVGPHLPNGRYLMRVRIRDRAGNLTVSQSSLRIRS